MNKFFVLISVAPTVLYLSACTETFTATPDEIIIIQQFDIWDSDPAARKAEEHCARFGKAARLKGKTGRIRRFACEHGS